MAENQSRRSSDSSASSIVGYANQPIEVEPVSRSGPIAGADGSMSRPAHGGATEPASEETGFVLVSNPYLANTSSRMFQEISFAPFTWKDTAINREQKTRLRTQDNNGVTANVDEITLQPSISHLFDSTEKIETSARDGAYARRMKQIMQLNAQRSDPPLESPGLYTEPRALPRWLKWNLLAAKTTAVLWFGVAIVMMAFAGVLMEDLRHDDGDYACGEYYIVGADQPLNPNDFSIGAPTRYHGQCRLLFQWSYVVMVASALSLFRALMQGVRAQRPSFRIGLDGDSREGCFTTPGIYLARAITSLIPSLLYLACTVMLATTRLITGPATRDPSYKQMYSVCLALLVLSTVTSLHQAYFTFIASVYFRSHR